MAALPQDALKKVWNGDSSLWSGGKYGKAATGFLGWVTVAEQMLDRIPEIEQFVADAKAAGFERCVLAGMGGSSLAPLVFRTCLKGEGGLPLEVLDSTDPETVLRIERLGPVDKCLFVVSSKSGSTAEPNAFKDYFHAQIAKTKGDAAGENFAAITDPGSPFEAEAKKLGYRKIFLNWPDIGGRYSALSYFGIVPAALMGLDVRELLERAVAVMKANGPDVLLDDAPAGRLGRALGEHALHGRDKLTFLLPDALATTGLWMEQLTAESTGKEGRGILPIALERAAPADHYGDDRVFVRIDEANSPDASLARIVEGLEKAGRPVIDFPLEDRYDIAAAMMEFEFAIAIAGAVIEINPFDQPNVQESKDITKKYVHEIEVNGSLPPESPTCTEGDLAVYGGEGKSVAECFHTFLAQVTAGDYICLQNYLTESPELSAELENLQAALRDRFKVAVTNGYGPRFLHSTGQFHKGGPNTGHFIQLTKDDLEDAPLPGMNCSFGTFRDAQARGDKDALITHKRRVVRIHLGKSPTRAVAMLTGLVTSGS